MEMVKSKPKDEYKVFVLWTPIVIIIGGIAAYYNWLAPIHEFGHIVAIWLTGGDAGFTNWSEMWYDGGNRFIMALAGYFTELLVGTLILLKLHRKAHSVYEGHMNWRMAFRKWGAAFVVGYFIAFHADIARGLDWDIIGWIAGRSVEAFYKNVAFAWMIINIILGIKVMAKK